MDLDPLVCIVGFHHARGPEIESWFGPEEGSDPAEENEWPLLPFMALSDGAHASTEEFSYFTLRRGAKDDRPATSLFGISCSRQMDANQLINRPSDVTRSTVQKAVVVVADTAQYFGQLREKLSIVTKAWFAQRDFTDTTILKDFQESLAKTFQDMEGEKDPIFGLSLREMIHEYKHQTLVLFKCLLLQPKMLFFGSNCERLCMMQFSLISLIPGLISKLQDSADPQFNSNEENMVMPTSLKTSERASLLAYMGLPLQVFGKGSLFGPYTPLQQLDLLADQNTKSYVVGSTNSLLLSQKERYSDILINLDETSVSISSQSLRNELALTVPDRRWIDFLVQTVNDTWDEANPSRPITLGYSGSEEFIRLQFEEYLLALLSAVKHRMFLEAKNGGDKDIISEVDGDPSVEFGAEWIKAWMKTENFRIFSKFTDTHIFDIVEPNHPCTGGLTIDDVQRRVQQQIAELHLDERFQSGREVLGKHLATGQKKMSTAFNNLWADIESMRESQRQRAMEQKAASGNNVSVSSDGKQAYPMKLRAPDLIQAQASVQAASQKAGAYLSSWGAWASEKRKTGWGRSNSNANSTPTSPKSATAIGRSNWSISSFSGSIKDDNEDIPRATGFARDSKLSCSSQDRVSAPGAVAPVRVEPPSPAKDPTPSEPSPRPTDAKLSPTKNSPPPASPNPWATESVASIEHQPSATSREPVSAIAAAGTQLPPMEAKNENLRHSREIGSEMGLVETNKTSFATGSGTPPTEDKPSANKSDSSSPAKVVS